MISRVDFGDIRDWKKVGVSLVGVKECGCLPQFLHTQASQAPFLGYPGVVVYRSGRIFELQKLRLTRGLDFKIDLTSRD